MCREPPFRRSPTQRRWTSQTQGYEFDLPSEGTFTLRLQSTNVNSFATLHVTLARLNGRVPARL